MHSLLKSIFSVLLISLCTVFVYAKSHIDSLITVVNNQQTIEVHAYEQLLIYYAKNEPDSLYNLGKTLLNRAVDEDNEVAEMLAYLYLADYYSERGKHGLALENLNRTREFYERNYNPTELVNIYNGIGNVHFRKGAFKDAVKWYLKSMAKGDEVDNVWMMNLAKLNLGRSYIQLKDTLKGEATILDYIEQVRRLDRTTELANAYNVLGGYYQGLGEYDLTDYYFNEALVISMTNADKRNVAHSYNNLAISYYYQGKKELSKAYFLKALKSRNELGNWLHIAESYYNIGDWFFFENSLDSAAYYYKRSYDVGQQANSFSSMSDALLALTEVEKARANFPKALSYYEEYVELKEQQFLSSTNEDIAVLEFDHMMAEAKRKNKFLNDKQQTEIEMNQFIGRNKWFSIVAVFIVFLLVIGLITRLFSERKVFSNRLTKQVNAFEKELTDFRNRCANQENRLTTIGVELGKLMRIEQVSSTLITLGKPSLCETRSIKIDDTHVFCWMAELELAESMLLWAYFDRNKQLLIHGDDIDDLLVQQKIIESHKLQWFVFDSVQRKVIRKSGVSIFQAGIEKELKQDLIEPFLVLRTDLLKTDFHVISQLEQDLIKMRSFSTEMLQNSYADLILKGEGKKTEVCFYVA